MPSTGVASKCVLLGSGLCHWQLNRRAQSQFKSRGTLRRDTAASSLADARIRVESIPGLTDFYGARLGSEGEVSALCVGTYVLRGSFTR